jgi:hypothetical protein
MRINSSTRYATLAALVGALACARNTARTDEAAAAKDTTTVNRDTLSGQTPSDTFLQNQGAGTPQDTAGYSGIERDTTHQTPQPGQTDTSSIRSDTTGAGGVSDTSVTGGAADTSGYNQSSGNQNSANPSSGSATGLDSTGQSVSGDTTGYNQSQQQRDSTSR